MKKLENAKMLGTDTEGSEAAAEDAVLFAAASKVVSSDRLQPLMLVRAAGQGTRV